MPDPSDTALLMRYAENPAIFKYNIKILHHTDKEGYTPLALALINKVNVEKIREIMAYVCSLEPTARTNFLMNRFNGLSYFMLALQHNPKAFVYFWNEIRLFENDELKRVLLEEDCHGNNILMSCVQNKLEASASVLDALSSINDEKAWKRILTQVDTEGYNVFMKAAKYFPNALNQLYKILKSLNDNELTRDVLTQSTTLRENILFLAINSSLQAVETVLNFMKTLPNELSASILTHINGERENALMHAVRIKAQPHTIELILNFMKSFNRALVVNILTQRNSIGYNAMMLATVKPSTTLRLIIDVLKSLDNGVVTNILLHSCYVCLVATENMVTEYFTGNAFMLVCICAPEAGDSLLNRILLLDTVAQNKVLSLNNLGYRDTAKFFEKIYKLSPFSQTKIMIANPVYMGRNKRHLSSGAKKLVTTYCKLSQYQPKKWLCIPFKNRHFDEFKAAMIAALEDNRPFNPAPFTNIINNKSLFLSKAFHRFRPYIENLLHEPDKANESTQKIVSRLTNLKDHSKAAADKDCSEEQKETSPQAKQVFINEPHNSIASNEVSIPEEQAISTLGL